ncbi:MAG TPA: GspH/FimT family pseudopilin [Pyrinomonadaceae bacterium]|jgi:prepilin-type N-terminal cleavage/methylation domain-containing protein
MKMLAVNRQKHLTKNRGFSIPELLIVLLVASIILVLALPQLISSRRLMKFSAMQRQVSASLIEARQEAMSQRRPITFCYDDRNKQLITYGGSFGAFGDAKNKVYNLSGFGVDSADIKYGRPGGVSAAALSDTTNMTSLARSIVEVTFQPDGSVIDASNNPQNSALFFYHNKYKKDAAFAVSILGAGGRIKVWRYSKGVNAYVE